MTLKSKAFRKGIQLFVVDLSDTYHGEHRRFVHINKNPSQAERKQYEAPNPSADGVGFELASYHLMKVSDDNNNT